MAVVVDGNRERSRIAELESIQNQLRMWRWGVIVVVFIILAGCVLKLWNSIHGLTNSGPTQDEFVQDFNQSLQTQTVPQLESEASATLTEIQPELRNSVMKLKDQLPDIAQTAQDQVKQLQADLPTKGEAILNKHFASIISSREDKIKQMYPNVTEDQLKSLVTNLTDHARTQVQAANQDLFAPHQMRLQSIMASMNQIKTEEAANVKGDQPDWEMGVLLLDIFRDDLTNLYGVGNSTPVAKPAAAPAATKPVAINKIVKEHA